MSDITATEAARHFSDLLDGVEHGGESYTIYRRGRPIANVTPYPPYGNGAAVRAAIRDDPVDTAWAEELVELRAAAHAQDRSW